MTKFDVALKKYLGIFADQEMYFVNDLRNLELFGNIPLNVNEEDVRTKISALNDTDIRQLSVQEDMIHHILDLKIDDRLKQGDPSLVDDIAKLLVKGQTHHLLHFASVYCNFHKPDAFPIFSDQHLEFYKKYIVNNNLALDPEKIDTYDVFSRALNDLVERLGLTGKMNYLQLRKFGWLYAEAVVKESQA
ncbi:MAG TPA: hypothetical protein VFW11_07120 [Cyclobacteriaceae bacterium]|nr:hypothetical protein [Cyclobacteriaceae bacterium]